MKETIMKIVVIGGTGLIGSKLVNKLREHGYEAAAAAPNTGVNTLTGEGLAEVLKGASVVVDVSNAPSWDDAAVLNFFETSTRNLLSCEGAAGVGHHVALSVVGTDQLSESGYFRAKIAQEKLIKESPIPYTIIHAMRRLATLKDPREVIADPNALYSGARITDKTLVPGKNARLGETRFETWLTLPAAQIPSAHPKPNAA
jgi:NAD(P)-dependent dehydrogenase (short-subunit alcohol dehydrogenase family)